MKLLISLVLSIASSMVNAESFATAEQNCLTRETKEPIVIEFCEAFIKIRDKRKKCTESGFTCDITELKSVSALTDYIKVKSDLVSNNKFDADKLKEKCSGDTKIAYLLCETAFYIKEAQRVCTKSTSECNSDKEKLFRKIDAYSELRLTWDKEEVKELTEKLEKLKSKQQ